MRPKRQSELILMNFDHNIRSKGRLRSLVKAQDCAIGAGQNGFKITRIWAGKVYTPHLTAPSKSSLASLVYTPHLQRKQAHALRLGTDGACSLLFCAAKRSGAFPPNTPAGLRARVSRLGGFTRPFSRYLLPPAGARLFVITGEAATSRPRSSPILMG